MDGKSLCIQCKRCGRKLKSLRAQQRGYGDYCWLQHKKEQKASRKTLFNVLGTK